MLAEHQIIICLIERPLHSLSHRWAHQTFSTVSQWLLWGAASQHHMWRRMAAKGRKLPSGHPHQNE